jgi:hypothetical protein
LPGDSAREVFALPPCGATLEGPNLFGTLRSPAFTLARRLGQQLLYKWYGLRDDAS